MTQPDRIDDLIVFLLWCVAIGGVALLAAAMEWAIGWVRDRWRWVKWFNRN